MEVLYSFVIDQDPKYLHQAKIFISNLLNCGVSAHQIIAHLTPTASAEAEEVLNKHSISHERIPFGPDKKFCNKIMQLFSNQLSAISYDVLALCDTDLAIIEKLDAVAKYDFVRARRVGGPNPPIRILDKLSKIMNITQKPNFIRTNCSDEMTYEYNCNGGLLLIPKMYLDAISKLWLQHAESLHEQSDVFEIWLNHIDQVAWAFALMQLELPYQELDITSNFPTGNAKLIDTGYGMPTVLHHHNDIDENGLIKHTGVEIVDAAIDRANQCISYYY